MASGGDASWIDELQDQTSNDIPPQSLEDANKALQEIATSQETISQMVKEIQALIKDGNNLDTRLFDVQSLVAKAALPSQDRAKELRDAYVSLLWNSRSIATSAKAAADDFRGDMIDLILIPDLSPTDKIAELDNWVQMTSQKGEAAQKQPEEFLKLTTQIEEYATVVEGEIQDQDTEAKAKLEQLNADVAATTAEIESLTVNIIQPIIEYLKLAGGAFSGLLSGSPEAAFAALLAAVKQGIPELQRFSEDLQATQIKRRDLEAKKAELITQIRAVESQQLTLGDASAVPGSLRSIADGIKDFAGRMTTFTNSFSQLENEATGIRDTLAKGTPVDDPIFSTTITLVRELFGINSKILDIYSKASLSD